MKVGLILLANLLSLPPLFILCARLLILPINLIIGFPLGEFGDPPVFGMIAAFCVTPVLMAMCNIRLNLGHPKTALLFVVCSYALCIGTVLFFNRVFWGSFYF
jgi:hypothetical protein